MIPFLPQKQIHYADIEQLLNESHKANHYTNNGPVKRELESALESLLDISDDKRVLCCSNGTTALHSIMNLCSSKCRRTWVTPAFTFPSCVVGHGFNIDILDTDPDTHTLPLDRRLLASYDAVIITNLFGSYVDIDEWVNLCRDNNKLLIFDNAASPLSLHDGRSICNFGDYSFGSLHHTKYLGFGEGGFVVCPRDDYDALSYITNFGFSDSRKHSKMSSNFKMSDVSAAFILSHIDCFDLDAHLAVQNKLTDGISNMKHVQPFNYKHNTIYNTFPVVFDHKIDEYHFCNLGIRAHKYYRPLMALPNSLDLFDRIINFPLYADLNDSQINHIITEIGNAK